MKIVTSSEYEIFNEYSSEGEIIKKAGYTCYQTEAKINSKVKQIIELIKKNKHYELLEFAWYPLLLKPLSQGSKFFEEVNEILKEFNSQKYLNCTLSDQGVIISGNGRAWYEYLIQNLSTNILSRGIYNFLNKINPFLFNTNDTYINENLWIQLLTKEQIQLKERTLNDIPFILDEKERDKHDWLAIKFSGISYGMIGELVRFRVMSYAQMYNYYAPQIDFKFIIDDGAIKKNSIDMQKLTEALDKVQESYNYLLYRGHKRDVVRQLLPIGIAGDIMVAGTIEGWKNIFEFKIKEKAHWEIKCIMNDLKKELNENYNYNF